MLQYGRIQFGCDDELPLDRGVDTVGTAYQIRNADEVRVIVAFPGELLFNRNFYKCAIYVTQDRASVTSNFPDYFCVCRDFAITSAEIAIEISTP